MGFLKNSILSTVSQFFSVSNLIHISGENVIFPFYHAISDEYLPHISPLYKPNNIRSFKEDLDFVLKHFQPINMDDFYLHMQGEKIITKPSFHLSFDDGLREIHDIVSPILYEKGIPATVFINSAFVDNKDLFYRYKAALVINKLNHAFVSKQVRKEIEKLLHEINIKESSLQSGILKINYLQQGQIDKIASFMDIDFSDFLQQKRPYLSITELKDLQTKGFSIGGHSIDHPEYVLLDEERQISQTLTSCQYVKEQFTEKRCYFSFPFSSIGIKDSFFSKIQNTIDLTFGVSGINTSHQKRHIERIWMERNPKKAENRIKNAYLVHVIKNSKPLLQKKQSKPS